MTFKGEITRKTCVVNFTQEGLSRVPQCDKRIHSDMSLIKLLKLKDMCKTRNLGSKMGSLQGRIESGSELLYNRISGSRVTADNEVIA